MFLAFIVHGMWLFVFVLLILSAQLVDLCINNNIKERTLLFVVVVSVVKAVSTYIVISQRYLETLSVCTGLPKTNEGTSVKQMFNSLLLRNTKTGLTSFTEPILSLSASAIHIILLSYQKLAFHNSNNNNNSNIGVNMLNSVL